MGETALEKFNVQVDDQTRSRWIIQPKFETPILNFKDYVNDDGHTSNVTLPNNASSASVPIGMWHQHGRIPSENEGIYMQVTDIPSQWMRGYHNRAVSDIAKTGSLADLCGFLRQESDSSTRPGCQCFQFTRHSDNVDLFDFHGHL